jgi:hypothetical protein
MTAVDSLAAETGYGTILAGHGLPADPSVFVTVTEYPTAARDLLGDDGEAYKEAILKRFPTFGGGFMILGDLPDYRPVDPEVLMDRQVAERADLAPTGAYPASGSWPCRRESAVTSLVLCGRPGPGSAG